MCGVLTEIQTSRSTPEAAEVCHKTRPRAEEERLIRLKDIFALERIIFTCRDLKQPEEEKKPRTTQKQPEDKSTPALSSFSTKLNKPKLQPEPQPLSESEEVDDYVSNQMAKRMFHDSGDDGRSVMGMLTVQVERDPRTGATVVKSVAPTSAGGGDRVHTVFDDGRKSIHTVGGSGGQPSTEELGQILKVIDGVGMEALLDEVTVVPNLTEVKTEKVEASGILKEKLPSLSTHHAASEDNMLDRRYVLEAEPSVEDGGRREDIMAVGDVGIEDVDDPRGRTRGGEEGMLTAERVIITEDGEEHLMEPETAAPPPSGSSEAAEQEVERELQDVPLEGAGAKVQREDGDQGLREPSSPRTAETGDTSKPKTCKCCSVM
ncbi:unnamed protein product [Pleuronectes platessa]|uniref:Paralemmin n=1 Tax=Pleuronectes platessa TaxID=8262 RepID=A0A9N7UPJ3_PLEPL|nr:unnamed protein product [Pleuronectes platessa]